MSMTEADWAALTISDAGATPTTNNVQNMERWMTAEEPTSDWYDRNNPLNASLGNGSTDGTGSYPDLTTGAHYTALMLEQSNMGGILAALKADASPDQFSAAVVTSPWAASHYGVAAAGAPAKYISAGRGMDYIATLPAGGDGPAASASAAGSGATLTANIPGTNIHIPGTGSGSAILPSALDPSSFLGIGAYLAGLAAALGMVVLGVFKMANPGQTLRQTVTNAGQSIAQGQAAGRPGGGSPAEGAGAGEAGAGDLPLAAAAAV